MASAGGEGGGSSSLLDTAGGGFSSSGDGLASGFSFGGSAGEGASPAAAAAILGVSAGGGFTFPGAAAGEGEEGGAAASSFPPSSEAPAAGSGPDQGQLSRELALAVQSIVASVAEKNEQISAAVGREDFEAAGAFFFPPPPIFERSTRYKHTTTQTHDTPFCLSFFVLFLDAIQLDIDALEEERGKKVALLENLLGHPPSEQDIASFAQGDASTAAAPVVSGFSF